MKKGETKSNSCKAIHFWLKREYGKATCCERCKREGKYNGRMWSIEWALKPYKTYKRDRENFETLCRWCHRKQDHTPEISENIWNTRYEKYGALGRRIYA